PLTRLGRVLLYTSAVEAHRAACSIQDDVRVPLARGRYLAKTTWPGTHLIDRRTSMLRSRASLPVSLVAAALLMAPALNAPAPAAGAGGHATVLNVFYPEVWDSHIAGTIGPLAAFSPLYNQIVEFNPIKPTEITGDLAKRWEVSSDGRTYTFFLHENVKWWDGKDLTAEDVAFSLKRMVEPGKPRPRRGLLRPY